MSGWLVAAVAGQRALGSLKQLRLAHEEMANGREGTCKHCLVNFSKLKRKSLDLQLLDVTQKIKFVRARNMNCRCRAKYFW